MLDGAAKICTLQASPQNPCAFEPCDFMMQLLLLRCANPLLHPGCFESSMLAAQACQGCFACTICCRRCPVQRKSSAILCVPCPYLTSRLARSSMGVSRVAPQASLPVACVMAPPVPTRRPCSDKADHMRSAYACLHARKTLAVIFPHVVHARPSKPWTPACCMSSILVWCQ